MINVPATIPTTAPIEMPELWFGSIFPIVDSCVVDEALTVELVEGKGAVKVSEFVSVVGGRVSGFGVVGFEVTVEVGSVV